MNNEMVLSIAKRIAKDLQGRWRQYYESAEILSEAYIVVAAYMNKKVNYRTLKQKAMAILAANYRKDKLGGMTFKNQKGTIPVDVDEIMGVELKMGDNGCGDGKEIKKQGYLAGKDNVNEALFMFGSQDVELRDFVNRVIGEMSAVQGQAAIECILGDGSEENFAEKYGVTTRTVRNYKRKAQAAFRAAAKKRDIKMEDFLKG